MYMPFADLRDGYSCAVDKQIWWKVFASMTQRPASVDSFQNHFHMQVVFTDTTDVLPDKIYENFKCAITLENKQLSI